MKTAKSIHDTLRNYILVDGMHNVFDAKKSHGSYFVDATSGKEYLDLFSFFATQPIRFNHPRVNNEAFIHEIGTVALHRPSLSDVYTEEYAQAVETFATLAGKGIFRHYFFVEGGTLGVENTLKVSFDWKVRKNISQGKGEKGSKVIHFKDAFHGRSGYSLSMTNTSDPNKYKYFPKFPWPRVSNPYLRFPATPEVLAETAKKEAQALAEIKQALVDHRDDIACLIIEPIQAEGGDNHFRKEFFMELRKLADENEFLLIFDEVQTGIGLTGKMWGFEHFVTPDLIAFGKKVQLGGLAATSRIDDIQDNVFHVSSRINSTWGGNLVDLVRMTRFLEIIRDEKLVENAETMGAELLQKLTALSEKFPVISNVRGRGLMIAFDLPSTEIRNQLRTLLHEKGAIILACGTKSLRLRPHLDLNSDEIDHAIRIFESALSNLKG